MGADVQLPRHLAGRIVEQAQELEEQEQPAALWCTSPLLYAIYNFL